MKIYASFSVFILCASWISLACEDFECSGYNYVVNCNIRIEIMENVTIAICIDILDSITCYENVPVPGNTTNISIQIVISDDKEDVIDGHNSSLPEAAAVGDQNQYLHYNLYVLFVIVIGLPFAVYGVRFLIYIHGMYLKLVKIRLAKRDLNNTTEPCPNRHSKHGSNPV